jgi:hypothetical protein
MPGCLPRKDKPAMIKLTKLCKIAYKYGTDKCPQLNHCYTPFYYELLKNRLYSIKKVLEIGIGNRQIQKEFITHYTTGASLRMWRDFLPNAQIYGADNDPETMFKSRRIKTIICDETKKEDLEKLIEITGRDIDLLIDDGSHNSRDQNFLCQTLKPILKKDVIYIIEDVRLPRTLTRLLSNYKTVIPNLPEKERLKGARDIVMTVCNKP